MPLGRRGLLGAGLVLAASGPARAAQSFNQFLAGVRAEGLRRGISPATLNRALSGLHPDPKVIELDRHQPEFTFTWDQYRSRIVSDARVARGRTLYAQHRALLEQVRARYGVPPGVIMGIWGLESNYGTATGGFNVIDALATLAWEGRRASFFRSELMDALRILDHGDIGFAQMTGSYAGAMGQTQFMPDSFLRYAVDWSGTGRRDIWGDLGCVFASTANYLMQEGWNPDLPWGERIAVPPDLSPYEIGRDHRRPVAEWLRRGVRRLDSRTPIDEQASAAVLLPGGPGGSGGPGGPGGPGGEDRGQGSEAYFAYYPSFLAIRRYNPSDFYCICVGLIGDRVTA